VGYTIADWLNLVYSMGTDTTYADGSARVPGTGSAWTWTRDQSLTPGVTTACIGTPPINALNMQYIVAGDSTARTPTMITDSWLANAPLVGMNKNSGTYTSWVNALPFTSGQFSGLTRLSSIGVFAGSAFPQTLIMFESQETFIVTWNRTDVSGQEMLGAGAFVDPLSGAAANAETDGRLYSTVVSGGSTFMNAGWLGLGVGPLNSVVTTNDAHFYTFNVGATNVIRNTAKIGSFTSTSNAFLAPNGEVPNIPLSMYFTASAQYAGQLRQMGITKWGTTGAQWDVTGVQKGYPLGYASNTTGGSLLLSY
jgi:hypothetical protein